MLMSATKPTRRPRVRFEGDVLIRNALRDRPIRARVRNLSSRGIAITTENPPAEGEEIECRLSIGGQRRTLRGRVAWVRVQPAGERAASAAGAGIEFVDLAEPDQELLTKIVAGADDGAESVDVWVDGMAHPLRMRGLVQAEELKLGFRLPRLIEGAALRLRFEHRGVTEERVGSIAAVKLLPGDAETLARLVLQVTTPRPDSGQGTLGAIDDVTVIDRPVPQTEISVLVDPTALEPPDSDEKTVIVARELAPPAGDEQTVIVSRERIARAPKPTPPPSRVLRAWQLGTAAALVVGVLIGALIARPAPAPSSPSVARPAGVAPAPAAAVRPAPPIVIVPIAPKATHPRRR
jgi:hypothetical protein